MVLNNNFAPGEKMKRFPSDSEAKEMILDIGRRMYLKDFVAANDGNITIKVAEDRIWATPTGVSKGFLHPEQLVLIDSQGNIIEGNCKPSFEIKMHLRVYKENETVGAVVHAHPPVATSFATANIKLDLAILPDTIVTLGEVPVAPYALTGTEEVAESVAPFCKTHNAVLLANHGALSWGKDIQEAFYRMESLEHYAKIILISKYLIKQCNLLTDSQIEDLVKIRESFGTFSGGRPVGK